MIRCDEEYVDKIYGNYEDEKLKEEYSVYKAIYEVENVESSLLIELLDTVHNRLIEECASRFVNSNSSKNVIYLRHS